LGEKREKGRKEHWQHFVKEGDLLTREEVGEGKEGQWPKED